MSPPRIRWARTTTTMSGNFIGHVYTQFFEALTASARSRSGYSRQGRNLYAANSAPAYVVAVAAVEAFVNECFLSEAWMGGAQVTVVSPKALERMDIRTKVIVVPQLALGRTLPRDQQPYQDFALLAQVRNELVHYKMGWAPTFVRVLAQRGIALKVEPEAEEARGGIAWGHRLSTTEGIRWAHNTAVDTVQALARLFPEDSRIRPFAYSWPVITDAML